MMKVFLDTPRELRKPDKSGCVTKAAFALP
jgi:hypothetical protein